MSPPRRRLVGGLDLGGTKIQAVVMDGRREVIGEAKSATPTTDGAQDVILALVSTMGTACADAGVELADLAGVGVGSPGAIDTRRGVVTGARNLPGEGAPIPRRGGLQDARRHARLRGQRRDGRRQRGVRARRGAALEVAARASGGAPAWAAGSCSTASRWEGRGAAGELGHVVVEDRRSRVHLRPARLHGGLRRPRRDGAPRAPRCTSAGRKTDLFKIMEKRGRTRLTSGVWARALEDDDELAHELIERALGALGAGVASAVNLLDVETVVIGGGLGTRLGEPYVERIREAMQPHLFVDDRRRAWRWPSSATSAGRWARRCWCRPARPAASARTAAR